MAEPTAVPEVARLVALVGRLRTECPWDAEQTHQSLVTHLVEETCEVVEALEAGDDTDMVEELGDLLLQVVFHATIAAERGSFTIDDVASGISDKLVRRHPYVFAGGEVPDDLTSSWEQRKAAEKGRSSVLEGIPERLSALARASKIINRARNRDVAIDLPDEPISEQELAAQLLDLAGRAHASGLDAEQVMRGATRELESQVRAAESA